MIKYLCEQIWSLPFIVSQAKEHTETKQKMKVIVIIDIHIPPCVK